MPKVYGEYTNSIHSHKKFKKKNKKKTLTMSLSLVENSEKDLSLFIFIFSNLVVNICNLDSVTMEILSWVTAKIFQVFLAYLHVVILLNLSILTPLKMQ